MKAAVICPEGLEDVSALEIKELTGKKAETGKTVALFETDDYQDVCRVAYKAQCCKRVLLLLKILKINKQEDVEKDIKKLELEKWLDRKTKFRARCRIINNEKLLSSEIEGAIGEAIIESTKEKNNYLQKVSLESPDIIFYAHICENSLYLGIDFTGFNASKRKYKIFSHAASLNGAIAYGLTRISGYNGKGTFLDCFAGAGMIPIEAALFSLNMSQNYFNKNDFAFRKLKPLKDIDFEEFFKKEDSRIRKKTDTRINALDASMWALKAASKNAKIADVNKQIDLSRVDIEWLDTKFKKGEIDFIVSKPIQISKRINKKDVEKLYREFFHQAEYVLAEKGRIVLAVSGKDSAELLKKHAEENKFKLSKERTVWQGKEEMAVLTFLKA